ncbi:hypothetical protein EDEG_00098 [Edhazardia aedis USNM 41457]|uniref:mRNA guanylyltransferase n=1 Tax=Edhazardia aedis (strain USNM 41457) TaxID=1003232 RepID=J9DB42_EDHAE|nr:hypothetical protein EDEG_00098 [Edhazardia aedis USNM 41457]|eukprot:EJW04981.1 hypothetical protein EDEG_00098 [Edhazardia aedis USNM 41457]
MENELDISKIFWKLKKKIARDKMLAQICTKIYNSIGRRFNSTQECEFPGSHPVTLLKKNFEDLNKRDYYVCEKSDGVRLMLNYLPENREYMYFLDRKNEFYAHPIKFKNDRTLNHTLFDGELFEIKDDDRKYLMYAIYDAVIFDGKYIGNLSLNQRLTYAMKFVNEYIEKPEVLGITIKKMSKSYHCYEIYKQTSQQKHKNDGLIFTPVDEPYVPGRCNILFKWKPAELNTVDLKLKLIPGTKYTYELLCWSKSSEMMVYDIFIDKEGVEMDEKLCLEKMNENANTSNSTKLPQNQSFPEISDNILQDGIQSQLNCVKNTLDLDHIIKKRKTEDLNINDTFSDVRNDLTYDDKQKFTANIQNISAKFISKNSERYDGLIGEFWYDPSAEKIDLVDNSFVNGAWILHKIRIDKTSPNSYKVVSNIMLSIYESLSIDVLAENVGKIYKNWKEREELKRKDMEISDFFRK